MARGRSAVCRRRDERQARQASRWPSRWNRAADAGRGIALKGRIERAGAAEHLLLGQRAAQEPPPGCTPLAKLSAKGARPRAASRWAATNVVSFVTAAERILARYAKDALTAAGLVATLLTSSSEVAAAFPLGACGYYTNSSGHAVPRPCGDWHNQPTPPRATARCADGTYSYSEHPSAPGTCSHHGGVVQ